MTEIELVNYVIEADVETVLNKLRFVLANGKLKDIQKRGSDLLVTCPHHDGGHEAKPACNIYLGKDGKLGYGTFHCFVCDESGSFLKFVAECFDSSLEYAEGWLTTNFPCHKKEHKRYFDFDTFDPHEKKEAKIVSPAALEPMQSWHPYLAKRKLSMELCRKFNVRYDPKDRTVVFPAYDKAGNLVMLPKRSVDKKSFYLDKDADKPVYCLNEVLKEGYDWAAITEGPFDCLTGWQYGIPTIATFGMPSKEQIGILNHSGLKRIYLCFDNDAAGRSFALELRRYINRRILLFCTQFPQNRKDLNDLSKEEFLAALKSAKIAERPQFKPKLPYINNVRESDASGQ